MKKTGTEMINVNGIDFKIGYLMESEFSGYVCSMKKDGNWYGALLTDTYNHELGWNSGVYATDNELEAIKTARGIMKEKYGANRYHG